MIYALQMMYTTLYIIKNDEILILPLIPSIAAEAVPRHITTNDQTKKDECSLVVVLIGFTGYKPIASLADIHSSSIGFAVLMA